MLRIDSDPQIYAFFKLKLFIISQDVIGVIKPMPDVSKQDNRL